MADYYPLLAKAVAGLPNSTPETRRAIYERARAALIGQLRRMDPPVPEADLDREAESLEAAVARLEAEFAPTPEAAFPTEPVAEALPRDPAAIAGGSSPAEASAAEPEGDRPGDQEPAPAPATPPEAQKPPPFKVRREPRPTPISGAKDGAESKPGGRNLRLPITPIASRPSPVRDGVAALEAAPEPAAAPPNETLGAPGSGARGAVPAETGLGEPNVQASDIQAANPLGPISGDAGLGAQGASSAPQSLQLGMKARSDAQRPFAPQPRREAAAPKRLWIVGAIIGLCVLLVAIAAFELRDRPEDLAGLKPPPSPSADAGSSGKIVDRIGVGGATGEAPASSGSAASGAAGRKDAAKSAEEPADPATAVARRAAFLIEAPEEPSKVKTYLGSVVWRVDNVSNGPGEPLTTAVRADIEIPEEKLQAVMTFQKNFDATLPASHTMKINFILAPGGPLADVQEINVPQMRNDYKETGDALSGVPVPVTQNAFLVGLSRGAAEATNLDLLRSREWIDVPIVLSNGRIAKLTFEKGPAGQRALEDALASWQAQ